AGGAYQLCLQRRSRGLPGFDPVATAAGWRYPGGLQPVAALGIRQGQAPEGPGAAPRGGEEDMPIWLVKWWKPLAVVALVAGAYLGGWVTNGWRMGQEIAEEQASQAKADLAEFKRQADRLSGISTTFEQAAVAL